MSNNPAQLMNIPEQIREEGYSLVNGEYSPGVCYITVPIFDDYDMFVASPGFSLPTARMSPEIMDSTVESLKNYSSKANSRIYLKPDN